LSGRARVVSEMIELLRTIDAMDKFAAHCVKSHPPIVGMELLFAMMSGQIGKEVGELLPKMLAEMGPTFPGLAGRLEIPRMVAALGGILIDSEGRPLLLSDGTAFRLGDIMWFNGWSESALDMWGRFPTRLSPLLVNGFDALYSVIGFDGRSLSSPRFMAIQSQVNASEFEWLHGHEPMSESWVRAAIEFLKDSISLDHNVLGEMLEEALTHGRFHMSVMRGVVEEGKAVPGSFSFSMCQ
jgi:hypothetical protein